MIGLTATLKRTDGQHWKIAEMFDCRLFEYTAKEALTDNILSPFEATEIMIKLDSFTRDQYDKLTQEINMLMAQAGGYINMMKGNFKNVALAKMMERKQLVNNYPKKPSIIAKICQKHISEKMIVFNEYNEQTSKMYWELLDCGVRSCVFHSNIPQKIREQHLMDFRNGKYNVILASKVLDEGWNLPKLSCAIISAGNSTNRQTIQRLGRILRRQKDKLAKLYILTVADTIEDKYAEEKRKFLKLIAEKYTTIIEDDL
jgi:superfamily II DNA or RNA helicase